jgi:hypothetical protein
MSGTTLQWPYPTSATGRHDLHLLFPEAAVSTRDPLKRLRLSHGGEGENKEREISSTNVGKRGFPHIRRELCCTGCDSGTCHPIIAI